MQAAPVYFLDIPREERARFLVAEYATASVRALADSVRRISRRLGGQNAKYVLRFLEENRFYEAALICLQYYDKSYARGLGLHDPGKVIHVPGTRTDPVGNANAILKRAGWPDALK